MRFQLRTLLFAISLVAAFLGGRASIEPLIQEHQRKAELLDKQLKALEKLRPNLSSLWRAFESQRNQEKMQDRQRSCVRHRMTAESDHLWVFSALSALSAPLRWIWSLRCSP